MKDADANADVKADVKADTAPEANGRLTIRPTTKEELNSSLPHVTSSMLEAVNTCPKWGVIHNVHNKHFTVGFRQMALEAGSAMHEIFSLLNLYQVGLVQGFRDHMDVHGIHNFGNARWDQIRAPFFDSKMQGQEQRQLEAAIFLAFATGEFYDDPEDKNRTLANLEHCALELATYWLMNLRDFNIYIEDINDPQKEVGVEKSLDVVFTDNTDGFAFRFIGLADALYHNPVTNTVTLGEYKTTSSMNDAWRLAFETRHQITGYNAALQGYFTKVNNDAILLGSSIPVRKTTAPVQHFPVYRDPDAVLNFVNTVRHTQEVINRYNDNPLSAPMFTHSCNRYFRPCSLIDLCASSHEDQQAMFEQMLEAPTLSPSEQKALLQRGD